MQAKWAEHERVFGHKIEPKIREHIQRKLEVQPSRPITLEDLDGYLKDMMLVLKWAYAKGVSQSSYHKPDNGKRKTIRVKSLEQRLHLVDFVVSRNLLRKGRPQLRIDWRETVRAWNEAHPFDYTSGRVLKEAYYRAVREWPSAKMQRWVAWHRKAIEVLMNFPFDGSNPAELQVVIARTQQLSDDCDMMIKHYTETGFPGRLLNSSLAYLVQMWSQYLRTLNQYVKQEVPDERKHKTER